LFEQLYNTTLTLLGILDPIEASKFVGKHGDNINQYAAQVKKLQAERNIPNALQNEMQRQGKLARDMQSIKSEAFRYIKSMS